MKKNVFTGLLLAVFAMVTSCNSNNPDTLSSGTIEDLVEELLEKSGQNQSYVTIKTGVYEENNKADRARLMLLKAAGVITYKAERYAWWNKTLSVSNVYGYDNRVGGHLKKVGNVYYDLEEHFLVTVHLTDEGKKMMVDSIPEALPVVDEDMEQPKVNKEDFPEWNVDLSEHWKTIPNPEVKEEVDNVIPREDVYDLGEDLRRELEEDYPGDDYVEEMECDEVDDESPQRLSLNIKMTMAWKKAKEKCNEKEVILKASKLEVKKARFIQVFDDKSTGFRCGRAEVIIERVDVTAAGRVLKNYYNGTRMCAPVMLVYFCDKGWILQDNSLRLSAVSDLGIFMSKRGTVEGSDLSVSEAQEAAARAKGEVPQEEESYDYDF